MVAGICVLGQGQEQSRRDPEGPVALITGSSLGVVVGDGVTSGPDRRDPPSRGQERVGRRVCGGRVVGSVWEGLGVGPWGEGRRKDSSGATFRALGVCCQSTGQPRRSDSAWVLGPCHLSSSRKPALPHPSFPANLLHLGLSPLTNPSPWLEGWEV